MLKINAKMGHVCFLEYLVILFTPCLSNQNKLHIWKKIMKIENICSNKKIVALKSFSQF